MVFEMLKIPSKTNKQKLQELVFYIKKAFWKIYQNLQEITCAIVSFLIKLQASASNFTKKATQAQVFFCEFWEIYKNAIST